MSELVLYTSEDGKTRLDLRIQGETIWLTQLEIAELFQTTKQNVSLHAKNIFEDGELTAGATVKESLTVQTEGKRTVQRPTQFYNLDLILAIGYDQDCSWPDCWRHAFPGTIRVVFPTGQREWLPRQAHEAEVL